MICNNCGKELKEGIKFCPMCGSPVSVQTQIPEPATPVHTDIPYSGNKEAYADPDKTVGFGYTPNGTYIPPTDIPDQTKPKNKSKKKLVIILGSVFAVLAVVAATFFALIHFDVIDNPFSSEKTNTEKNVGTNNNVPSHEDGSVTDTTSAELSAKTLQGYWEAEFEVAPVLTKILNLYVDQSAGLDTEDLFEDTAPIRYYLKIEEDQIKEGVLIDDLALFADNLIDVLLEALISSTDQFEELGLSRDMLKLYLKSELGDFDFKDMIDVDKMDVDGIFVFMKETLSYETEGNILYISDDESEMTLEYKDGNLDVISTDIKTDKSSEYTDGTNSLDLSNIIGIINNSLNFRKLTDKDLEELEEAYGSYDTSDFEKEEEIVQDTPSTEDTEESELEFGAVTESTYENKSIGLGCSIPSDWRFYSDEEIELLTGQIADRVGGSTADLLERNGVVIDMYATNSSSTATINVVIEKGKISDYYDSMEEYYEEAMKTVEQSLSTALITVKESKLTTVTIGDIDFLAVNISAENLSVPLYETLMVYESGEYTVTVTASSYPTDKTIEFFDYFYFTE